MLKFRNKMFRSYSPPVADNMPGYYEAKAERKESVRKLRNRYSKFASMDLFNRENLLSVEPF